MSTSFRLQNGDLVIGAGRSFETVSGASKMAQDLELWILERVGNDPSVPDYGSILDGGIIDGQTQNSFIGQIANQTRVNEVRSEILSLISRYQKNQVDKIKKETVQYAGKTTLTPDEVIQSVDSITAVILGTIIVVKVLITTANSTQFKLLIPMPVASDA